MAIEEKNINEIGETCIVCEKERERGFHLYNQFICNNCEQEIVHTDTNDQKYKYFIEKLRKITKTEQHS